MRSLNDDQIIIVDYPTGCKVVPPSSAFERFEDWVQAMKDAPWCLPPEPKMARVHDLATERRKRAKR